MSLTGLPRLFLMRKIKNVDSKVKSGTITWQQYYNAQGDEKSILSDALSALSKNSELTSKVNDDY